MGAEVLSKDVFTKMVQEMDTDGSGEVDENEFRTVYSKMFPDMTDADLKGVWQQIDADGSGTLEVTELAAFYGFSWDGDCANEMTDEQILDALKMHAALLEAEDAEKKQKKEEEEAPKQLERDKTIILVNSDASKNSGVDGADVMRELAEALTLSELSGDKDGQDVETLLTKVKDIRFQDEKGEMPLHKLAKVQVTDGNKLVFKKIFKDMVEMYRASLKASGSKRPLVADINHQDKQGKTPLYHAVDAKNLKMIDMLYSLETVEKKEGPDSLLVNSVGWTVVHAATHTMDVEVLKSLFKHFSRARAKVLLQTKDKTGRTPLHIASFKDEELDVVKFLIENGAENTAKDAAGRLPSQLGELAGRRKSKEYIEEKTGQFPSNERRKSRESKEAAPAADEAAAA